MFLGCVNKQYITSDNISNEIVLTISKINIKNTVNISSIKEDVIGIVMFSEYGRPDNEKNTVIGAHSGYGSNAYFNLLDKLAIGDEVKLKFNGKYYLYEVNLVKIVSEKDLSPLEDNERNTLTLMTCKIDDSNKRIVVISKLKLVV